MFPLFSMLENYIQVWVPGPVDTFFTNAPILWSLLAANYRLVNHSNAS